MNTQFSVRGEPAIVPLGDQAVLAYLADEAAAVRFADGIRTSQFPWLLDVVPAYASVGVFFDADRVRSADVIAALQALPIPRDDHPKRRRSRDVAAVDTSRLHVIPCCYEMQLDLQRVAEQTRLAPEEIIAAHCGHTYTLYAIGFAPGFPYLGYLPEALCGVSRLPTPRVRVEPGTVGMTGRQTGIYPLVRPGGWNLIGRTPLLLVDVEGGYFPLRVGDRVEFQRIDAAEFAKLQGERLPSGHADPIPAE
jgi:inhibitor of KinA